MVTLPRDASHTSLLKSHCRTRQCDFKSAVCAARKGHLIIKPSRFCEGFLGFILSRRLRFVRLRLVLPQFGFVRFRGYFVSFRSARPFSFCGL